MRYELQVIRWKHRLVVALLLFLLAGGASVEAQPRHTWQVGLDGQVARPQGSLKDAVGDNAFGLTVSAGYRVKRTLLVGMDLGSLDYQNMKWETSPPVAPAETSGRIDLIHALARLQSDRGAIRPYLDLLLGISRPKVTTEIMESDRLYPAVIEESVNTGFSYGGGAGLMLSTSHPSRGLDLSLKLQLRYLSGSRADYLRRGSLRLQEGRVAFDTTRARQQLLVFGVGVVFDFDF